MPTDAPREALEPKTPRQRPGRGALVAWIALGVIALLFLTYLKWRPLPDGISGVDHPVAGKRLVALAFEPLTGSGERVTQPDVQGRVTLINIWGTWCPPCQEEFPHLAAIYAKFKDRRDFQYLSVSYGADPTLLDAQSLAQLREATAEFLQEQRADHPTYYDPEAQTLRGLLAVGFKGAFPTSLIIDRRGSIHAVWEGFSRPSMAEIEQVLRELLK
ncbi:MAG: TlpA disulfide reductase family protein [Pirellulales bacterium]